MTKENELANKISTLENKLDQLLEAFKVRKPKTEYTLYSWLDYWYLKYKVGHVEDSTIKHLEITIRKHVKPYFEDCELSELTVELAEDCLLAIDSTRMREEAKNVLFEAVKKAQLYGYVSMNVFALIDVPAHIRKEGHALTADEEETFWLYSSNSSYYTSYFFMRWTGCRPGEAFLTKWEYVDFEQKTVWIDGTKTDGSKRLVPLFAPLCKLLKKMYEKRKDEYVFGKQTGDGAKHAIVRIQVPFHVTFKDFRTTFATDCASKGVPDIILAKWLGHTTTKTTQRFYKKFCPISSANRCRNTKRK